LLSHQTTLDTIVAAGPGAYDPNADGLAVINAALDSLDALATLPCDGYILSEPVPVGPTGTFVGPILGLTGAALLAWRGAGANGGRRKKLAGEG
jgi:hypothetical protein